MVINLRVDFDQITKAKVCLEIYDWNTLWIYESAIKNTAFQWDFCGFRCYIHTYVPMSLV